MVNGSTRIAATLLCFLASVSAAPANAEPLPLPYGCQVAGRDTNPDSYRTHHGPAFPPVQLEIHTPFEPTIFPAGGHDYLIYELHLQNFTGSPMNLHGIEIFDASGPENGPIASLVGPRLFQTLVPIGVDSLDADHPLEAGRRAVSFICLAFDEGSKAPERLQHRVLLDDSVAEGPVISARNGEPKTLGPPVSGEGWVAVSGLNFSAHHRSGLFVAGGLAQISRRYAIDWKRIEGGAFFSGDARDVRSYHTYGEEVLAVADAIVVIARDGFPDNIPRTSAGFETAVPITMESIAGNSIVLDLGDGQFAYYAHLKPGSLRVQTGDRVRRGQPLALIGNSGDAREPHLHFQVTNGPDILASEGMPYTIDRYRIKLTDGTWQDRIHEFPLSDAMIDFPVHR